MRMNKYYQSYLHERRITIKKDARRLLHRKIQQINNRLIDKKILEYDTTSDTTIDTFKPAVYGSEIIKLNRIATAQDFQKLLSNSMVTKADWSRLVANNTARDVADKITAKEIQRIESNLKAVENVMNDASVNISQYKTLIEKLPPTTSRQEILNRTLERGHNLRGREYTQRELERLSRDLERYKSNRLDYETKRMENQQAYREGLDRIHQTKTWNWSELENTRHSQMDGQTVDFASKFEVVNEVTGDTDYLLFAGDIDNEHNNCSNTCNCQCWTSYENEEVTVENQSYSLSEVAYSSDAQGWQ